MFSLVVVEIDNSPSSQPVPRTAQMEPGYVVFFVIGPVICGGLVGIATELHRIAKALEEANKLRSRQTQP